MQPSRAQNALMCTNMPSKCYKISLLFGILFLSSSFYGCEMINSGDIRNNIIDWQQDSDLMGNALETTIPSDWIYGAIMSEKKESAEQLLQYIPYSSQIETIVILAPTDYHTEAFKTFTYSSISTNQEINFDTENINLLTSSNNIKNLGEIGEKSYWTNHILETVSIRFPSAKIIPISVNKEMDDWKTQSLAFIFKTTLPEKSLVISIADISTDNENEPLKNYQKQFITSALMNPSQSRFGAVTKEKSPQLQVLEQYLTYKQSQKAQLLQTSNHQAIYQKSSDESVSTDETPVFLVSFGDMMLGRYVQTLMSRNTEDYAFSLIDNTYLKMNDLLLANLEGPIAKNAIQTSKTIAFRFLPSVVPLIKKYHFDILSLANNHALDMGTQGYTDSRELLTEAGILNFGDPRQLTDDTITKIVKNGQKLAFIGLEEVVYDIDDGKTIEAIKKLSEEGYKVIVMPHWGIEYVHKPNQRQRDLAHKMIDAGAFMVIGHHPHVVQAYETYNGHPIFYSLGNFIFDQYWSEDTQIGLTIALAFTTDKIEITFLPIRIDYSRPRLMNEERIDFMEEFVTYGEYAPEERQEIQTGKITIYPK